MNFGLMMDDSRLSYYYNRINKSDIPDVEKMIKIKIGKQLEEYILDYGYIGYEFVEFYEIKRKQMKKSNMIKQTQWLHNNYVLTYNLVAFEDQGDGYFYLVDSEDKMFKFVADKNKLTPLNIDLYDYIIERFNQVAATKRY